ncbi:winged helix-turn-helix transcriptional regulator [Streptomyces cucumeris]|uniref:winged helix-turn-helix transcriptional regulator n=1 Tax=Streptomyces cucumeris TaxID=2962890 RepID=UPI003D743403
MASQAPAGVGHQTETHADDRDDGGGWDDDLVPSRSGRTRRPEPDCPVEAALAAVSGRWATLLLRELMGGPRGFTELRALLPELSPKVLSDRLRALRERGLVAVERQPGFPVRTRYTLTEAGRALRPLLIELYATGEALLRLTSAGPVPPVPPSRGPSPVRRPPAGGPPLRPPPSRCPGSDR